MLRVFRHSTGAQAALAFVLILLLKWNVLTQPPAWDTAMGMFPAALTLAENGFDLIGLLGMPEYLAGGPNTHGTSLVTLFTALILMLTGGGVTSFVVLHLLHFGIAAAALGCLFRFARPVLGDAATAMLCLSALLYPVFLVQVGYMYMEVPLFLCAVCALLTWTRNRFWLAALWAALAFAVKETGIIVPATLIAASLFEKRRLGARVRRAGQIASLPAIWWVSVTLLRVAARPANSDGFEVIPTFVFGDFDHYLVRFLYNVPDLLALLLAFLIAALVLGRDTVSTLRQEPADPQLGPRADLPLALSGVLILGFLLLFFVALPLAAQFTIILPRYYVIILPFLLLWVGYMAQALGRRLGGRVRRPAVFTLGLLSVFFALNRGGRFYPPDIDTEGPGNDFALTERSEAYLRLNSIQKDALAFLETLPDGTPVYYGHYEHYLLTYPDLGYASGPLSNGHSLSLEPLSDLLQGPAPLTCVYVLYNYPWLGGEKMLALFHLADTEPDLSREIVREFRDGRYSISLTRIRYADSTCPA